MRKTYPALALAAVLALFAAARAPLFTSQGIFHGWNSDAAIIGLMGKKIADGRGLDIFFWGQNYMGPLTSMVAAGVGLLRRIAGLEPAVGPMALRVATSLMITSGIVTFWLLLRSAGVAVATLTAAFLAVGPYVLYRASVASWGIEMVFLLGALIIATGIRMTSASSAAWRLLFGVLCGFAWWMNQQVVFFIAAIVWVIVRRTEWFGPAVRSLRIRDRLLFRGFGFSASERALLLSAETLLIGELLYVSLRSIFRWSTPAPGFRWHFGEPFFALLLLHLGIAAWKRDPILTSIRWRAVVRYIAPAAAGFLLGYSPVFLGGILGWYPRAYSFGAGFSDPDEVLRSLADLLTGVLPSIFGSPGGVVIAVSIVAVWLFRRPGRLPVILEALLVAAALNLLYCALIVPPPIPRRYLVAAIPGLFALVALALTGLAKRWRAAAVAAAAALFITIAASSFAMMADLLSDDDPRPVIASLKRHGCDVVYAEFWTAYRYRFLTNEEIKFIVHESQDRTPRDSAEYAKAPGQRCFLQPGARLKLMNELPAVADVVGEDVLTETVR